MTAYLQAITQITPQNWGIDLHKDNAQNKKLRIPYIIHQVEIYAPIIVIINQTYSDV